MPSKIEHFRQLSDRTAREEMGKSFPFENELKEKSARLVELDTLLNLSKPEELAYPDDNPQFIPDAGENPEAPDWDE